MFLDVHKYFCPEPAIDSTTQAAVGCTKNHTVEGKLKMYYKAYEVH